MHGRIDDDPLQRNSDERSLGQTVGQRSRAIDQHVALQQPRRIPRIDYIDQRTTVRLPDREAGGIGGRIGFCRRSGRSDGPAGCRPKRYGQPCQADFPAIFHIEDKINITIRNANFPLGRGALSPLTDSPFQEKPSLGRVGPESEPDIPSPLEMRTDGGYGIPPSVAHQGKPTLRGSLCGTVKIAGTKRDRPFSSGKKYLEVKAGSGKPGKTCTPLWTRSIDAREQGQVFWLVSPRAVFPPPEGDSDCSDRPTHGKRLTAAGTAPDSEHGSSPDSLLRLLRRGETPPLPDETKLNTFFYRTTFSTTDFHPPGETPARGNALPSSKARATGHARTATSRTAPSLPCHSIAAYLLYRTVLSPLLPDPKSSEPVSFCRSDSLSLPNPATSIGGQ